MNTQTILATLGGSLLSGVVSVLVSYYFYSRLERRKLKTETARKLFRYRHRSESQEFKEAVNEAPIVFADNAEVVKATINVYNEFEKPKDNRSEEPLLTLIKVVSKDLNINHNQVSEKYLLGGLS